MAKWPHKILTDTHGTIDSTDAVLGISWADLHGWWKAHLSQTQTQTVDTSTATTPTVDTSTQTVDTSSTPTQPVDTSTQTVSQPQSPPTQTVDTSTQTVSQPQSTPTQTVDTSTQTASQPQSAPTQTGDTSTQVASSAPSVTLTHSTTAVHSDHDGQVIENLDLYITHGDAVTITNDNVTLRNCRIHYADGNGVSVSGANHVTIENCEIIETAPPSGISQGTSDNVDILAYQSPNLTVHNTTVRDGSTGIYLLESPGANLSQIDGYDFHGPFPHGQFVQFDKSGGSTLTDFYAVDLPTSSSPEDIVSVYASPNTTISNGVIDGNNSQSGVGVMFENGSTGGRVTNVDAIHQGNGAFSSYDSNVVFDHTRSFDNIATDQGRGLSLSNALIWNVSSPGVSITNSTYTHPADPNNIVWDASKAVVADVHEDPAATPMAHIVNHYAWS